MTFERRALGKAQEVNWEKSQTTFSNLHVTSSGTIESDGAGMLQVHVSFSVPHCGLVVVNAMSCLLSRGPRLDRLLSCGYYLDG